MNTRLEAFRRMMQQYNLDAFILPCSDPHLSEYIPERWKSLKWISGFTGSAGTAIITQHFAGLWTDNRYFIQAEKQITAHEFQLMKLKVQGQPEYLHWLVGHLDAGSTVGVVGNSYPLNLYQTAREILVAGNCDIRLCEDFWDSLWPDRPAFPESAVWEYDLKFAGESRQHKLERIKQNLKEQDSDIHLISTLDDIAWTLNLRGSDISYNPFFLSYLIIGQAENLLFINETKVSSEIKQQLEADQVKLMPYDSLTSYLADLPEGMKIMIDKRKISAGLLQHVKKGVLIKNNINPSIYFKSRKNKTELKEFDRIMLLDGISLTKFYFWLEQNCGLIKITESSLVQKLYEFRKEHESYISDSFSCIVSYQENAALNHYSPTPGNDMEITGNGLLLIDSGGHYYGGTTDVTRTIAIGEVSQEEKDDYTLVLKGLIALSQAIFPEGTLTNSLDVLARAPLWQKNRNYSHGTGHGVGACLSVHEGPQSFGSGINAVPDTPLEEHMIITIEPGIYHEGKYGIRIENIVRVVKGNAPSFLCFKPLTLCYIESSLLNATLLSEPEITWLNEYNQKVFHQLSPFLSKDETKWLRTKTTPLPVKKLSAGTIISLS